MIGVKLRDLREEKGLSQKELGEILNIGNKTISDYEHGRSLPDIKSLRQYSRFFAVSIDYLVTNQEDMEDQIIDYYLCNLGRRIKKENLTDEEKRRIVAIIEGTIEGYFKK